MSQGLVVLAAVLAAALAFGTWRAVRDGSFRRRRASCGAAEHDLLDQATRPLLDRLDHPLGERATLLQFSSAFCTPCRATRRVLQEVAEIVPGVAHVEVDAEQHLELVRELGVLRTPTTLVLDADGREVSRASGAPRKDAVLVTLGRVLGA